MSDILSLGADLTILSLLERHPETVTVFLNHRMACVGCDMAAFETITEAAEHYDLPLAPFLVELEQAAAAQRTKDRQ